jgi:hypothetical protein
MDALPNLPTTGRDTVIRFPRPGAIDRPPPRSRKDDPTHATTLGFAYVNEIGRDASRRQPFAFPVGTMIVRERLLPPSTTAEMLVVMIKHENGFNRKANGWEFLTIKGDATKILKREKAGACLKCHASAAGNDFVFPEDRKK